MEHTEILKLLRDNIDCLRLLIITTKSEHESRLAVKVIQKNREYISEIENELHNLHESHREQMNPIEELNNLFESFNPKKK